MGIGPHCGRDARGSAETGNGRPWDNPASLRVAASRPRPGGLIERVTVIFAKLQEDKASAVRAEANVLAVDDDATARKALTLRLNAQGYRVVTAASGAAALDLLGREPFDVMLLDVRMPGQSGLDVLRRVRERYSASQLPVIMLTVSEHRGDIVDALELGANDYVVKPGDIPVLVARIKTQLSLKATGDQLRQARAELERRVLERTMELIESNERLKREAAQRAEVEQALRASEQRYRSFYDNNPSMFFTLDPDGLIQSANRFGAHQLGYTRSDLIGSSVFDVYHPDDRTLARQYLLGTLEIPDRLHRWEIRKLHSNGTCIWMRETARVIEDLDGQRAILMVCEDISEAQHLSERLSYQESHDALTALVNRSSFEARVNNVLLDAKAEHTEHALCYLDLDQFKVINDTCGHAAGDELLRQVAQLLKQTVGALDTLARLGGDEFAVLMEYCSIEQATQMAHNLRDEINDYQFVWGEKSFRLSASIGLVSISETSGDVAAVLGMADAACYAAKDAGRNRVHVYRETDLELTRRHGEMQWVARINRALEEDRFHLHVQPIAPINAADRCGDHYEVLVRLRDEEGHVVPPNAFLPAAERYNLAGKLDRWVIATALSWLRNHPVALERLHLCSINLSGHSLGDERLLSFVTDQLESNGIPPRKICFEITETTAIANLSNAKHFLETLKERGCLFALDDFGSGLSSFAYLKNLPVDFLKIDGAFVKDIVDHPIDFAMVKSINEIGHVMGKKTIAEFVESEAVLAQLRKIGVDYVQGYGIGRPQPIETIADL